MSRSTSSTSLCQFLKLAPEICTDRRQFQIRSLKARPGFLILGAGVVETDGCTVRQRIELNRARDHPGGDPWIDFPGRKKSGKTRGRKVGRELSSCRLTGAFVERFATG